MESITKNLGIVLLVAAALRILNIAKFSTAAQLGFALAALFITLADVAEFEWSFNEQSITLPEERKRGRKSLEKKVNWYHRFALFSLVVLPSLRYDLVQKWDKLNDFFSWYVSNINDGVTLIALGLVIYLIAMKKKLAYRKKLRDMLGKGED